MNVRGEGRGSTLLAAVSKATNKKRRNDEMASELASWTLELNKAS